MDFSALKASSSKDFSAIANAATEASEGKKSYKDERLWNVTQDKDGSGYARVRLLPSLQAGKTPWVQYFDHGFQGPTGQWYIEKSLTTLNQDDPVSEANSVLWNSGSEANKQIARDRKRRLNYVVNVLVVEDPANPENEGKVFIYKFGKVIFDMIQNAMNPKKVRGRVPDPINPFDFWSGADFEIDFYKDEAGWRKYSNSQFSNPGSIAFKDGTALTDEQMQDIYENQMHNIQEFVDPSTFKSYDELKDRLNKVLGEVQMSDEQRQALETTADEQEFASAPDPMESARSTPSFSEPEVDTDDVVEEEESDAMSYFDSLINK